MRVRTLSSLLAPVALAAVASAQAVQVGDSPNFTFGDKSFNTQGAKSAADLRGKPVLVDFWGIH